MNLNLNTLAQDIYKANKEKGFWDKERNVGELLMLVTSELAEALEADRKEYRFLPYNYNRQIQINMQQGMTLEKAKHEAFGVFCKNSFEDEIADAIIRLLDLSAGLGIDIDWHVEQKLAFNKTRERMHGKKY